MFELGLKKSEIMTVDLHNMPAAEAKKWLTSKVTNAPKGIKEIEVIHGYHNGTALMNMVRKSFNHPRVERKILGMNQGSTFLILK